MIHWRPGLLAAIVAVLVSCSAAPKVPDPAALEAGAAARILAIPPAIPEKYRGMADMKGWRNPYLVVNTDGFALLDPDNHQAHLFKPEQLTQALGNLPSSAWPYGRVVAVAQNSQSGSADESVKIRKNRAVVAGTLEGMQVLIRWVPSA